MRIWARCLTLAFLTLACRDEPGRSPDASSDTIAAIGTGTELLLTRERLAVIDRWIRESIARTGTAPASLDEVRPPETEAARYAPLERFLRDGWGRAIQYEYVPATSSYELRSSGGDGNLRTADDITVRGRV